MDNPEKLQTKRTQDEDKQNVHKTNQTKQQDNTICVGQHYTQTNTNNVNKK